MNTTTESFQQFFHDIKTPLATIKHGTQGLKLFLKPLLDAYLKAKHANLSLQEIQPHQMDMLYDVLNHIELSADLINEQIYKLKNSI